MKLSTGQAYAKALLRELRITDVPEIRAVARDLNLELNEIDVEGFDGVLIRADGVPFGAIAIRGAIREEGRKNFTIAHEIGHFVLPGHEEFNSPCLSSDVGNWSDVGKVREREADEFAAELLMPTSFVRSRFTHCLPSLELIREVARECQTSLSATAWRYCDFMPFAGAVVWSTNGKIAWSKATAEFGFYIRRGKILEQGTVAHASFLAGATTTDRAQIVPADLWLENDHLDDGAKLCEESVFLGNYGSVLSLLWVEAPLITTDETHELVPELDPFGLDSIKRRR